MTLSERTDERVLLAYGDLPFHGGVIFILRKEVRGHQWRRDFLPALGRYLRRLTGKPATHRDRLRGTHRATISGIECYEEGEGAAFIENAISGESDHHWTWYNPETREVEYIQGPKPKIEEE